MAKAIHKKFLTTEEWFRMFDDLGIGFEDLDDNELKCVRYIIEKYIDTEGKMKFGDALNSAREVFNATFDTNEVKN